MKNLLFVVSFLCFIMTPAYTYAADYSIKGKLVESGTNTIIDVADVILFRKGETKELMHTTPDGKGEFSLPGLNSGEYTLWVKLMGYEPVIMEDIKLQGKSIDLGTVPMTILEVGLGAVEFVSTRKQVIYKLDKKVVDASTSILANGGSAVDILENTPSIRVDAEGEVSFRGSSGFKVYIDGKPSIFSGTQALEQIPSGHIENIEIITTPSARHDTDGDVGIINIITKKNMQQGLSGTINISGSTMMSHNVDFLLNQQGNKSRWFIGGVWSETLRKSDFEQEKTTILGDTKTVSLSDGSRVGTVYQYSLKGGWVYSLPKTTVSIDGEGGYRGNKRRGELDYYEERYVSGTLVGQPEDYFSSDDYDNEETIGLGTVSIDHKFNDKGHNLSASFYHKYGWDALEYFQSDLFDTNNQRENGHRAYESETRITSRGNIDYVLPYSKTGRAELGYQYYSYLEDTEYKMEFWNPVTHEFDWRADIYNLTYFREQVNSVYTILAESWNAFNIQGGVRGEHTNTKLRSTVAGSDRRKNRFEYFPSAHIGYSFKGDHKVQFAYAKRTTRPQLFFMEPYITFRDYYTAEIGNPDIRPEYINSYETSYKKDIGENSISAILFHRSRKDKIERLRVPYTAGVTLDSMANVGRDYSTGVEINGNAKMAKWWNVTLSANLYNYRIKNELAAGGKDESSTNYSLLWNNALDAGKYTKIQFDGNFVGPSVTTQGKTDAFWYVNLAVRQQMLNRKVTSTLAFRDLLGSARYNSNINTGNLQSVTRIKPKFPNISLTLSYVFNSYRDTSQKGKQETQHDLFEGTNH